MRQIRARTVGLHRQSNNSRVRSAKLRPLPQFPLLQMPARVETSRYAPGRHRLWRGLDSNCLWLSYRTTAKITELRASSQPAGGLTGACHTGNNPTCAASAIPARFQLRSSYLRLQIVLAADGIRCACEPCSSSTDLPPASP